MADVQSAPTAPHNMVPPGMAEEDGDQPTRVQLNIDWGNVDLDSIVLPPGDDMGIKRYSLASTQLGFCFYPIRAASPR